MKKRWVSWWIGNMFWIIIFGIWTAIIWLRDVDGAGVTQTSEIKSISLIVLLIAFIIPVFIQVVWLIINLRMNRKNNYTIQFFQLTDKSLHKKERNQIWNRFLSFTYGGYAVLLKLHYSLFFTMHVHLSSSLTLSSSSPSLNIRL